MMRPTTTSDDHRDVRRLAFLAAALSIAVAVAIGFMMTSDSGATSNRVFEGGCDGVMVIANVRCELGVPTAFDGSTVGYERAPWCGNEPDVTVYGCAHDVHDVVWACGNVAPAHAAGADHRSDDLHCGPGDRIDDAVSASGWSNSATPAR